jgi:hypothetical protein
MMKRIAIVCCLSLLIQTGAAAADAGPLLKASLAKNPQQRFRTDTAASSRSVASDDDNQVTGTWMERHPVWTGAIVGFSAGFLLTYAVAASEDHSHQLLTPVDPGGPALVWGGVAAGVGALAGWGIGRSRDKNANPALGGTAIGVRQHKARGKSEK